MTIINEKKRNLLYCLISFCISSFVIFLIFAFNKMNGRDFLIIRSDFLDSICYYKEFARSIINHDSIYYSYSSNLGINNVLAVSGLISPFNILYVLFYKADYNLITAIIIIFKIGLASAAFQLYSIKILKNYRSISIIISVFYSLSAFAIEYGTILSLWLDVLFILPLICVSIVECIENNKRVNLILLYSYIFIVHFYMGYIIGIFSFLYFFLYLIILYKNDNERKFKVYFDKIMNWALSAVIAVMISAFLWVPTLFFLAANRVTDSTEVIGLSNTLLLILNSLFWGMDYGIDGTYSYIYSGILVLIFTPLFFFNKRINSKYKLFYGLIMIILLISTVSTRLNSVWHVFDQPDDFWYRYSFLLSFCFCSISSLELSKFEKDEGKKLIISVIGFSFFYQLMLQTCAYWDLGFGVLNTNYGFIINFILMILWAGIIFFLSCKNKYKIVLAVASLVILCFELISGSKRQMHFLINATSYNSWIEKFSTIAEEIKEKDNGFYRTIVVNNDVDYNVDTYFGLKGICDFGNMEKYEVRQFLSNIGFATSTRLICENGYNPISEMILGVKYIIHPYEVNIYDSNSNEDNFEDHINEIENNDVAESDAGTEQSFSYDINDYALNLGYLVNGKAVFYEYSGRNVFENMNEILSTFSGIEDNCYIPVSLDDAKFDSDNMTLSEMDTGEFVFSSNQTESQMIISVPKNNYDRAYIQFEKNAPAVYKSDYYIIDAQNTSNSVANRLSLSSSIEMATSEDGNNYQTTLYYSENYSPQYVSCDNINIYYFDENAFIKHFNELSKNQLNITKFKNGHIEGKIKVDGDKKLLFTTIPYDPGWKAYINGIETDPVRVIDGTFIGILLPSEGTFDITLDFECPGLKIGSIISICGIIAFLSVAFEKKIKAIKLKNK